MILPVGFIHNSQCAYEYSIKMRQKKSDKEHKAAKKRLKDNDRSFQVKKTQKIFNRYIRLRDNLLTCVSCDRHHMGQYHAGHYLSVGSHPELRFEPRNVHKQCAPCNNHRSGNATNYRRNLIIKVGIEQVEWIEGPHETKRYTLEELKGLQVYYKGKIKQLEAEL